MKHFYLEPAGTAEVLRAAQRDESIIERIQQQASELLLKVAGNRFWMKHHNSVFLLAKVLYAGVTTLSDIQTLGEEYTGIIQVNAQLKQLPSKQRRLLSLLLECFGGLLCSKLITVMERRLRHPSSLTVQSRAFLLEALGALKSSLAFVTRLHRAFFYWDGEYYLLSKRLCAIRYVLVRRWLKDRSAMKGFKLLSAVTFLQLFLYTLVTSAKWIWFLPSTLPKLQNSFQSEGREKNEMDDGRPLQNDAYHRCSLCLESRTNDTATPCGHIFCWNCIAEWLQTRSQCPLCRDFVEVSRLIPIQNVSKRLMSEKRVIQI